MHLTNSVRIPDVYYYGPGDNGNGSIIITEYLMIGGRANDYELGKQMAKMHLAEPLHEVNTNDTSLCAYRGLLTNQPFPLGPLQQLPQQLHRW